MSLIIRRLEAQDFEGWQPVWDLNMQGQIDPATTKITWHRIVDEQSDAMGGFGSFLDGSLVGIIHYATHFSTGTPKTVGYMQDMFVHPDHRQKGIAKELLSGLKGYAAMMTGNRVYWLTEPGNEAAQRFYDSVAIKIDFTVHVLPV